MFEQKQMLVEVGDVVLEMFCVGMSGYPAKSGLGADYYIKPFQADIARFKLPGTIALKRLARKYLNSPLHDFGRNYCLTIAIRGGISVEKRAAFLAPIAARTKVIRS